MNGKSDVQIPYEDIEATLKQTNKRHKRKSSKSYENASLGHIDKVIKAISFIVAIGVLLLFAAVAALLYMLDKIFSPIAIAVFIIGIVLALIFLFIIFGIGHIITLNKEILRRM